MIRTRWNTVPSSLQPAGTEKTQKYPLRIGPGLTRKNVVVGDMHETETFQVQRVGRCGRPGRGLDYRRIWASDSGIQLFNLRKCPMPIDFGPPPAWIPATLSARLSGLFETMNTLAMVLLYPILQISRR